MSEQATPPESDGERRKGYQEIADRLEAHTLIVEMQIEELAKNAAEQIEEYQKETGAQLEEFEKEIHERLRGFYGKALAVVAVIGLIAAAALGGFGFTLNRQAKNSRNIQTQRYDSLVQNCVEQNRRHDRTLQRAANLSLAEQSTIGLLVDELQPYNPNCEADAKQRVKGLASP